MTQHTFGAHAPTIHTATVRPEQASASGLQEKVQRAVDTALDTGFKAGYMQGVRQSQLQWACLGFILGCLFVAFWTWMGTVA